MEERQKHTNAPPRDDDSKDINEYEGKNDKDPDPKSHIQWWWYQTPVRLVRDFVHGLKVTIINDICRVAITPV